MHHVSALIFFLSLFKLEAYGSDPSAFKFCHAGPRTAIVKNPKRGKFKSCRGARVHVQSYMWKCDTKEKAQINTRQFFLRVKQSARRKCIQYCRDLGKDVGEKCKARFEPPRDCGFSLIPDHPGDVNERFGCKNRQPPNNCDGGYVSYCSLYHGSFLRPDPAYIVDKKENCFCDKRKD